MHDGKGHRKSDMDLLRRLPVPRGRLVLAVILVTTMLFMWARLLFSGKPDSAAAESNVQAGPAAVVAATESHPRLTGVDLPVVAGRNDRLARDFFTTANWKAFHSVQGRTLELPPADPSARQDLTEYDVEAIEQIIRLEGIIADRNENAREAFVNGKLLSVGGRLKIEYKSRQWVLTVIAIYENKVVFGLENYTLNVAMPQADSLNN